MFMNARRSFHLLILQKKHPPSERDEMASRIKGCKVALDQFLLKFMTFV